MVRIYVIIVLWNLYIIGFELDVYIYVNIYIYIDVCIYVYGRMNTHMQ